ncbi:hypothetical protein [Aquabacterium sp. OR-4]|uniref:hypothetical protein n=1 Tax=Aquabacterium sp. OR-4 TaxID=2978127 RepID=UPI0028C56DB6|nr:hypothetical protein [Aquabacterium sp. OR-4]MDT7837832.1 hypothetical protein [Aquabacterium sp. OR-4]
MPHPPASILTVNVSVVDGQVIVNPETLPVTDGPHTLEFRLQTLGYSFPTLGAIVIEGGHKSQFPQAPVWVNAQTVTLFDRNANRQPRSYSYRVAVLDALGRRRCTDPTITNEGRPVRLASDAHA